MKGLSREDMMDLLTQHGVEFKKDILEENLEKLFNEHIADMVKEEDIEDLGV